MFHINKLLVLCLVTFVIGLVGAISYHLISNNSSVQSIIPSQEFIFKDGFENASSLRDLQQEDRSRWHGTQQNDPNNTIGIDSSIVRSGTNSLKFTAVPTNSLLTVSKSDIQKEFLSFKEGDEVWFSGEYYIPSGINIQELFLWDLEDSSLPNSGGLRVFVSGAGKYLAVEQKFPPRGKLKQEKERELPRNTWTTIKIHLILSSSNGLVQIWQDTVLIFDSKLKTLYKPDTHYDRLQIGITANGKESNQSTTLYVDDIILSNKEI